MNGYFGEFGGRYVPEPLIPPLLELEEAMGRNLSNAAFQAELSDLLANYAGRPTPLTLCPTLSQELGFTLRLKREDLLFTGAHKINNTLGQALLAKKMGKTELVAETGAGQHGVAVATAAARLGLSSVIFMGAVDVSRQKTNVERMRLLGARVVPVEDGTKTLKDAINEALRYWLANQRSALYCFGTAAGPHPFPTLVRGFQAVISQEARDRYLEIIGRLPDLVVAAVGGGSNAIGAFAHFIPHKTALVGVEAAGTGEPGCHNSAPINLGSPGILHGQRSMLLQTPKGQVLPSHSISAGLDYPSVGPEHAYLNSTGRVTYGLATDREALEAFLALTRKEGIIPALEPSHGLAWILANQKNIPAGSEVMLCLSGRGDKDLEIVLENLPKMGYTLDGLAAERPAIDGSAAERSSSGGLASGALAPDALATDSANADG
jgi:tryptophan synthase beta chain